ncbi:PstS family phosphate ABC transporter substrate-binding protein [Xanthomonas arboricola]|uniref:PstS family phosphate ABC transporter substrate-binding protein n=2 Tax=Xanthomonas TaxID=338 RepID=UPI0012901F72|nr:substrate-binding domain-containing protein [Xanthomonas arboricola]
MRTSIMSPVSLATAVAAALVVLATPAMAAENLYGGGATFPAQPYVGNAYLTPNPDARLSTNAGNTAGGSSTVAGISAGSIFATFSAGANSNKVSYCQTGSGTGKNTLAGTVAANQACNDFSVAPAGLSAATATPDFIGTDAPYSTADYQAFLSGSNAAARVGVVQIPTIAGAIALSQSTATTALALTSAQVCQIYSGQVSDWSLVSGSGATGPIKIVYRTDGSGTSFAFTSYLARTCNGTANVPSGFVFTPNQTFNSALPGGVSTVYGSRGIGASGNNGVVTAVRATANTNALGYADIGEVLLQSAKYAKVNGFDPALFGQNGTPVSLAAAALLSGRVLDGATVNAAPGTGTQAVKNCVRLVNPAASITNAYPIAAITYVAGYTSGNGSAAHVQAVKDLFGIFYNTTTRPALPAGFAYLDGVAAFRTSVQNTVATCVQ